MSNPVDRRRLRQQQPDVRPGMGNADIWGTPIGGVPTSPTPLSSLPSASASTPRVPSVGSPQAPLAPKPLSPITPSPLAPSSPSSPPGAVRPLNGLSVPPTAPVSPTNPSSVDKAGDLALQGTIHAAKGLWAFSQEISSSAKAHNVSSLLDMSVTGLQASGILTGVGLVGWVISFALPPFNFMFAVVQAGLISAVGYLGLFATLQVFKPSSDSSSTSAPTPPPTSPISSIPSTPPSLFDYDDAEDDDDEDEDEFDSFDDDEDDEEDEDDWSDLAPKTLPTPSAAPNYESLMEAPINITPGTQTRSFLYEKALEGLIAISPSVGQMKDYSESSNYWAEMEEKLQGIAEAIGTPEDKLPDLKALRSNEFIIQMTFTRTPRIDKLAADLANTYRYDKFGKEINPNCFSSSAEFGDSATITIFRGTDPGMFSVKDLLTRERDYFTNPDNIMPVVLGITADGDPLVVDFAKVTSLSISGSPRMGKSWLAKSILNQLTLFNSPKDIHFYLGDPKGDISEYVNFNPPHVAMKELTVEGILDMIRYLVQVEAERRKTVFREAGNFKEIFEFRKANPSVDIPFIFLILDEMGTIHSKLQEAGKDKLNEYRTLLSRLTTELPALGIKTIFTPHRMVDNMIPKNTYALIQNRITTAASPDAVNDNLGVSSKDFPMLVSKVGDLGIKMPQVRDDRPTLARAAVLAPTGQDMVKFEGYISSLWGKLEPGYKASDTLPKTDEEVYNSLPVWQPTSPEWEFEGDDVTDTPDFWKTL